MKRFFSILLVFVLLLAACDSDDNNKAGDDSSASYTIGLVTNNNNGMINVGGFQEGMAELGYVEGQNTTYIFPGEPVTGDDLTATLQDFVDKKVDLIFTAGTPTGKAAFEVTKDSDIPVVFGVIADPIAAGVMTDLDHPGGNMTGIMLSTNQARRLELLIEASTGMKTIYIVYNPNDAAPVGALEQIQEHAGVLEVEIIAIPATTDDEVTAAFADMPEDVDAIFMLPDSLVNAHVDEIVQLSIERKLPVSGPSAVQVEKGALMAYGIVHHEVGVQAASVADQILKGANPADLPVQTAEFFLVINRETANTIELELPYELLQQAFMIVGETEEE